MKYPDGLLAEDQKTSGERPTPPEPPADRITNEGRIAMPAMIVNTLRWIIYSVIFLPLFSSLNMKLSVMMSLSMIVGWFASALNEIITQLKELNSKIK